MTNLEPTNQIIENFGLNTPIRKLILLSLHLTENCRFDTLHLDAVIRYYSHLNRTQILTKGLDEVMENAVVLLENDFLDDLRAEYFLTDRGSQVAKYLASLIPEEQWRIIFFVSAQLRKLTDKETALLLNLMIPEENLYVNYIKRLTTGRLNILNKLYRKGVISDLTYQKWYTSESKKLQSQETSN